MSEDHSTHGHVNAYDAETCDALQESGHLTSFDELGISRVIYRETMPKLKQNIDIGDGVRAVVEAVDGDVISVFAATPGLQYGENLRVRVISLTPEQRAFVALVRNSMITGFLHLTQRINEVRAAGSRPDAHEKSVHDLLSEVLGEEPASFIAVRPFEVTEILDALKKLAD